MHLLMFLVLAIAMMVLVLGLVKPSWIRMKSRKRVLLMLLLSFVGMNVVVFTSPPTTLDDDIAQTSSKTAEEVKAAIDEIKVKQQAREL